MAEAFPNPRLHRIDQVLGYIPGYPFGEDFVNIEQR